MKAFTCRLATMGGVCIFITTILTLVFYFANTFYTVDRTMTDSIIKTHDSSIIEFDDHRSFVDLIKMRSVRPDLYKAIDVDLKLRILTSSLENDIALNDWGYLDLTGSYSGVATIATVELGPKAISYLLPVLDNKFVAFMTGSEISTLSRLYHYRRCDFAFRIILLILDEDKPIFLSDPRLRDDLIDDLKQRLRPK